MEQQDKFESWAIVELMGHRKLAGRVSEQVIAGTALLRIDVPEVAQKDGEANIPGFTQFYGTSSIYCLTPTSEEKLRGAMRVTIVKGRCRRMSCLCSFRLCRPRIRGNAVLRKAN